MRSRICVFHSFANLSLPMRRVAAAEYLIGHEAERKSVFPRLTNQDIARARRFRKRKGHGPQQDM